MQRAEGEGEEAGPSQARVRGDDGTPAGKTKRPNQDGVRRKKKRPPANGNSTLPADGVPSGTPRQRRAGMPERDRDRDRERSAHINPALRPYLATAPKPVSALTRAALDEAVPLRQSPRQEPASSIQSGLGQGGPGTGLILPSTFLRSRSSLNLSINESSAVSAPNVAPAAGANGRGGGGANVNAIGDGSDVALAPPIASAAPTGRMYAAGLIAPPLIVPAGSSAAMRQAQSQGRTAMVIKPTAAAERSRAGPSRRRERTNNRTAGDNGRRRSTEDLRSRQHPNNSSTSLTLLPGSSTLMRIPEDGTADPGSSGGAGTAAPAAGAGTGGARRRTRANEQLRRRPTVSSREEGRALGLSRGASMRRVNVWDDVSNVDEAEMEEPPPPFAFPPASGASPTARTGASAAGTGTGEEQVMEGESGEAGDAAPPEFVAGSHPAPSRDGAIGITVPAGGAVPSSPPPTFAQAMGLEPLPHSIPALGTSSRRASVRSQAARSVRSARGSSPSPTVYESAPSSPIASDDEGKDGGGSEAGSGTQPESTTSADSRRVGAERAAWEEDIRAGLELAERVRREWSRRRRREVVMRDETRQAVVREEGSVGEWPARSEAEVEAADDGEEAAAEARSLAGSTTHLDASRSPLQAGNSVDVAPAENQSEEGMVAPNAEQARSMSLLTEPASSPTDNQCVDTLSSSASTAGQPESTAQPAAATPSAVSIPDLRMGGEITADEPVTAGPSRKLTRGKAIRRSSSGYGSLTLAGSAQTSPSLEQGSTSPRLPQGTRKQQQAGPITSPSLAEQTSPQSSPRLPLFGDTGFDWRPASVHLSDGTAPEGSGFRVLSRGDRSQGTRASAPALSPPLSTSQISRNDRSAQRASIDFASVGPGRRVDDPSTAPEPLATPPEQSNTPSPAPSRTGSVLSPSGSRFHEMPRRSTESDILPHRQAAMKRRELFTAASTADALTDIPENGSSSIKAGPTLPTSPARLRMVDHLPSGPLVDFSDYEPNPARSNGQNDQRFDKGKGRSDSLSSSTSTVASTAFGSHRSRPLMPLPPELVALFHEEIPEELEEDQEEEEAGEEDVVNVAGEEGARREGSGKFVAATEDGSNTPKERRLSPGQTNSEIQPSRLPSLNIDTEKTLPMLPPRPKSLAPTESDDETASRKRAPPPPPALKRHLVSTTVGANLAPRRSIIRTADTPVTPRPIRQLGMTGPSMRRPPPPPPRPVSQHLQDVLEAQSAPRLGAPGGQSSLSEEEREIGRMEAHLGHGQTASGLLGRNDSSTKPGAGHSRDLQETVNQSTPAAFPAPHAAQLRQQPDRSSTSLEGSQPAATRISDPTPPALPPRPYGARPVYNREDSLVSSTDSVQSDPTTLSRLAPVPMFKPPAIGRPRGPRPRPPPIPPRPWIKVVTDDVEIPSIPAAENDIVRPSAERSRSDNSVRTMPNPPPESPSSMSTIRASTRRSTSERDLRGVTGSNDAVATPRSPRSPRASTARQQSMEYTDLDLLVSRLEGSGREYEGFTQITAFLGPGKTPAASANAIATLLPGLVSVDSRRVTKDGKVKLKLSLLGVRVAKCPICLAQFKKDERGVILPECGHHAHEACARKWFKEDGRCFVCREPLVEEGQAQEEGRARGSRMVEGVV